ncbi:MAG: OB-fold nucleic acid binding domain-containing protein [Bacteroidales bacterium]|nr:OB-fold nucleic acid binding domain-containing protein [Bacteroidales bacterium]
MQRSILWIFIALLAVSCNQTAKKEGVNPEAVKTEKIVSATIVEILAAPADYKDKEVAISGMVTHVCRHGGQKCFIVADDGETQIRVVPGGEIDEFKVEIEGSTIAIKGIFRVLNTEQAAEHQADHDSKEHHDEEQSHSSAEEAEYYLEALDFKEITL